MKKNKFIKNNGRGINTERGVRAHCVIFFTRSGQRWRANGKQKHSFSSVAATVMIPMIAPIILAIELIWIDSVCFGKQTAQISAAIAKLYPANPLPKICNTAVTPALAPDEQ